MVEPRSLLQRLERGRRVVRPGRYHGHRDLLLVCIVVDILQWLHALGQHESPDRGCQSGHLDVRAIAANYYDRVFARREVVDAPVEDIAANEDVID